MGGRVQELVFLGSGTSSCIPLIGCLMQEEPTCAVCLDAQRGGRRSKNCRLNVSAVVRFVGPGGATKAVLIDCGKTFYTAARRWAVPLRLGAFEGVLLTHGHADAMLGLDDLRHWTGHGAIQDSVVVYADRPTLAVVERAFPYLVDKGQATGGGFVSDIRFRTIAEHGGGPRDAFRIGGLEVTPVRVEHGTESDGAPYFCLGFLLDGGRIAYLSDVSRIPDETLALLQAARPQLLVLDCLREERPYRSHFILPESLAAVRAIAPARTYLVGMTHDTDHDEFEARLRTLAPELDIRLAHDGLVVDLRDQASDLDSI